MQKPFVSMIRSLMILLYSIRVFGGTIRPWPVSFQCHIIVGTLQLRDVAKLMVANMLSYCFCSSFSLLKRDNT